MFATTKELGAIKGISEAKVAKLKEMGGSPLRAGVLGAGPWAAVGCCRLAADCALLPVSPMDAAACNYAVASTVPHTWTADC